jgi:hypothetical protein
MLVLSALGDEAVLAVMVVAVYAAGRRRVALSLAAAILVSAGLNLAVKHSLGFPRPPSELHRVAVSSPSFPSGHAQIAATFWAMMAMRIRRLPVAAVGILVVTMVSVSRVYLGVHYLGDVLAGVSAGIAVAAVWTLVEPRVLPALADPRNAHLAGWAGAALAGVGGGIALNPFAPTHGTIAFVLAGLAFAHSLEADMAVAPPARPDWQIRLALSLACSTPLVFLAELLPPAAGAVPAVFAGLVGATAAPRIAARIGA